MSDERAPETAEAAVAVATPAGRSVVRIFLMVAGGLAAPALALAAFFLSNGGQAATSVRPPVAQAGVVDAGAAARPRSPSAAGPSTAGPSAAGSGPATTTTTVAPSPAGPPARDPFVPLVTQGASGTAGH
jgi:hypothetical protein